MKTESKTDDLFKIAGRAPINPAVEEWRIIPSHPDYEASSWGRIRRATIARGTKIGRILKPQFNKKAKNNIYLCVKIRAPNQAFGNKPIHRLVCEAFHGPPPSNKSHAAHYDGDKTNNHPHNLRWCTALENAADNHLHGKIVRGEKIGTAKLTTKQVRQIRQQIAGGIKQKIIAKQYGVSETTISEIKTRKKWSHIL